MGKTVKSIGKMTGSASTASVKPKPLDKNLWDISAQADEAKAQFNPLMQQSQQAAIQTAPNMAAVLGQMGQSALGQGPSVAEMQMKAAQDRNLAQQLAISQASRGGNAALNQRALMQGMNQSGRQLAQDSGIARLQEQQAAQQNFMGAAGAAQQQARADIGTNLDYGTLNKQSLQQWELADKGAMNAAQAQNAAQTAQQRGAMMGSVVQGGMMALSDERQKATNDGKDNVKRRIQQGDGTNYVNTVKAAIANSANKQKEGQEAGQKAGEQFGEALKKRKEKNAAAKADTKIAPQMSTLKPDANSIIAPAPSVSPVAAGAGSFLPGPAVAAPSPIQAGAGSFLPNAKPKAGSFTMGGLGSDKNNKEETPIDVDDKMQKFVDMLSARAYKYKDTSKPGTAEGQRYGVMAQDLEKSDVGASLVKDTPEGKMVDTQQGFGAILASQAALNERLKKIENKKNKKDA